MLHAQGYCSGLEAMENTTRVATARHVQVLHFNTPPSLLRQEEATHKNLYMSIPSGRRYKLLRKKAAAGRMVSLAQRALRAPLGGRKKTTGMEVRRGARPARQGGGRPNLCCAWCDLARAGGTVDTPQMCLQDSPWCDGSSPPQGSKVASWGSIFWLPACGKFGLNGLGRSVTKALQFPALGCAVSSSKRVAGQEAPARHHNPPAAATGAPVPVLLKPSRCD